MDSAKSLKFIVALTGHRHLGLIFVPYLVEPLSAYYSVRNIVRTEEMDRMDYDFNPVEKEIVRRAFKYADSPISARFSRFHNSTEFFANISPEYLASHVLPYVSRQLYAIGLLLMKNEIRLFEKEPKYANLYDEDIIRVPDHFARAGYYFAKNGEGTRYQVKIYLEDEHIPVINRKARIIAIDPCMIQVRDRLLIFRDMDSRKIQPFLDRDFIHVPRNVEPRYYSNFVLPMVRDHEVEATGFTIEYADDKKTALLSLEENLKNNPSLVLRLVYGEKEVLPNDSREVLVTMQNAGDAYIFRKTKRDADWERQIADFLTDRGLVEETGGYTLPGIGLLEPAMALYKLLGWVSANEGELMSIGFEIRQGFFEKTFFTGKPCISFDLDHRKDWFDLYGTVTLGDYSFPFIKLRKYLLNGIREFVLPNGQVAILPEEWFEQYRHLMQLGSAGGDRLSFRKHFYHLLSHSIPGILTETLIRIQQSLQLSENTEIPAGLKATLRSYQITGFRWMHSLVSSGLGGCLADDMGLGKTLQALALLLSFKRNTRYGFSSMLNRTDGQLTIFEEPGMNVGGHTASLVVVPTSLVHNWVNEIRKFAPSLDVYVHAGMHRLRDKKFEKMANQCDVVLTTYGTLRNDRELFEKVRFFILILDESQYIKNKTSRTFEAVMCLVADHHMVLTGTPVENSLSDLWSQMNFLNRGLLGSYTYFRKRFQLPVENRSDEKAGEKLQLLIRPFILRRTKDQVATDLPPLVESVMYCTMTPGQASLYEREKSIIRNGILSNISEHGIAASSILILKGLTRLRQLANHPSIVQVEDENGSGKFEEIMMALSALVSENHKVLIFSSFVTHLELIRQKIAAEGWKYSLLTGKTNDRETVIRNFQEDTENRIFLISLKAGGVGLNLTRADYVFIIDPWWNPAAENQAISRAHRIGQDKHVFVYRFITKNSIEEKIESLKARKSALADQFINSNNPFRALSKEDIETLFG